MALAIRPGSAALLAGRVGEWTFVHDDSSFTSVEDSMPLSADNRTAATSTCSIYSDAILTYAVNGEYRGFWIFNELDLPTDLPDMPAQLRAAFEAAGSVEVDRTAPITDDNAIFLRVACALAGLNFTLDDLRRIPLLATPFG